LDCLRNLLANIYRQIGLENECPVVPAEAQRLATLAVVGLANGQKPSVIVEDCSLYAFEVDLELRADRVDPCR